MKDYSYVFNAHPEFIDNIYKAFKNDRNSVEEGWRVFFDGFEFNGASANGASANGASAIGAAAVNGAAGMSVSTDIAKEFGVLSIIHGFRSRGHLLSTTNPIMNRRDRQPHLELTNYNLSEADLDKTFSAGHELGMGNATLKDIIARLETIYCGNIGFEYAHIENREKRVWLREKIEQRNLADDYGHSVEKKKHILRQINGAVIFEKFLHTKYIGQKRFSLEGGETTIAALDAIINFGAEDNVKEVVIGMAHRGRLNVLANILGKTYETIFNEFEGITPKDLSFGDGDVKYHLGFSSLRKTESGKEVHLKLAPNPSHLEAVNPVVEGYSRAKADMLYDGDYDKILPILIHGDAAIAGQGVVYEVVQMSQLEGYYTGGTIHFVINNQVGFTTDFDDARSSTYCTGVASIVHAPVFHINGDDPDAVVFAAELATEYRQKFNNDVFIDMVCYRKHGHNEGDDPKFTQPKMYEYIKNHKDPRVIYSEKLVQRGDTEKELSEKLEKEYWEVLQDRLNTVKENDVPYLLQEPEKNWESLKMPTEESDFDNSPVTGIDAKKRDLILNHLVKFPEGMTPLSKMKRLQKSKVKMLEADKLDWAFGELMAYGSILMEGKDVRMSGQDVKRGTFSHRHVVLNDAKDFKQYNILDGLDEKQGKFRIFNSLLSEFAVMGFEYGYAMARPNTLVLWEAQFGDFYNGAQSMVDQFISAGESKWQRMNGMVLLLPHGQEGQGPEHSSARLERWLQLCAEHNMVVTNITTPSNIFHALRRQLTWDFRKPLINMSPKSLLRHPLAVSSREDFSGDTKFQEVIDDPNAKASAKRLLICTGKVYYDLLTKKLKDKRDDVAIVRMEQMYPFPEKQINEIIRKYKGAKKFWVQEEPSNMGAWSFLMRYWRGLDIDLVSKKESASPATGYKYIHDKLQAKLVEDALG